MPFGPGARSAWVPGTTGLPAAKLIHYWRDDRWSAPSHDTRPGTEEPSPQKENGRHGSVPIAQPIQRHGLKIGLAGG